MNRTENSEIELLKASIGGNSAAFENIVRKYQSLVCAFTFSAIPDIEKSEDIAQEIFLHIWQNLSQLKDLRKFRSWLISITRNIINDTLRRQKRDLIKQATPIEQVEESQIRSPASKNTSTGEVKAVVQSALMAIPQKYREPLVLFYRQEQSVKLIAEQLEISEDAVRQHLSRGRKLLREKIADMVESSISRSGPTKMFTAAVMASVLGLAATGTAAAIGSASGISVIAKVFAAAAVVAIAVGTAFTYRYLRADETDNIPVDTNFQQEVAAIGDSDSIATAENTAVEQIPFQASLLTGKNIPAANVESNNLEETTNINTEIPTANEDATMPAITLKATPNYSPYEYFLFTRYNQESSTRTLVLAHITDSGIELKDIITEDFGAEPICVTAGKLYSVSYSNLHSIDLFTKQTEQFSVRPSNSLDYAFDFSNAVLERCFANNCLYGLAKTGDKTTLRQIDFEKGAYRDIADISLVQSSRNIAISPDKKRLAYFSLDPNGNHPSMDEGGYFLTIVEVESGKITQPAEPIKYIVTMLASVFPGIPIIWLDSETVAFIRTEIPEGENMFSPDRKAAHIVSTANVNTGQMEDITPLPGNPYAQFAPDLIQDNVGIGPLVQPKPDFQNNYRLDLKNRKLVENDLIAGSYGSEFEQLHYKDKDLGLVKSRYYKVSDDGERIIWMSNEPVISDSNENKEAAYRASVGTDDNLLYYYDEAQDEPVAVARVYNSVGLWLKTEDLQVRPSKTDLGPEWTPLKDISKNLTIQTNIPIRKYIRDYLTCTMETDKTTYQLHEPVQVTVTLTNKSDTDITISKPNVIESVMNPLSGLTISYPGGQTSIDSGAKPYSPVDEDILLKAGESFISTDTIEVSAIGDYSLKYTYDIRSIFQQEFMGSISSEPVAFNVLPVEDTEIERQLFETKFSRIMERFREDTAMDPNWNGNNNICDKIMGLPGMGPEVASYLIDVIESETNKNSRKILLKALSSIAGTQYIPFFKQQLINGETNPVCNWILKIHRENGTDTDIRQQAVDALLEGMKNEDMEFLSDVFRYIKQIYDERIVRYLEQNIDDYKGQIQIDVGYYLAAADWLELSDWLALAVAEPTYIRYISAKAVIQTLEQQMNISKGNLPNLSQTDFTASAKLPDEYFQVITDWLIWSQENPRASVLFFEEYRQQWWKNDPLSKDDL